MDKDPAVKEVVKLRNNAFAHRAVKPYCRVAKTRIPYSLLYRDINMLINRARDIVNRYLLLLNRETYSTTIVGHDDYQHILNAVRKSQKSVNLPGGSGEGWTARRRPGGWTAGPRPHTNRGGEHWA